MCFVNLLAGEQDLVGVGAAGRRGVGGGSRRLAGAGQAARFPGLQSGAAAAGWPWKCAQHGAPCTAGLTVLLVPSGLGGNRGLLQCGRVTGS